MKIIISQSLYSASKGLPSVSMPTQISRMFKYNALNWHDVIERVKGLSAFCKTALYYVIPSNVSTSCLVLAFDHLRNTLSAAVVKPAHLADRPTIVPALPALQKYAPLPLKDYLLGLPVEAA